MTMGVSVYVMPLETYLRGDFRTTWGTPEGVAGPPDQARGSDVDVEASIERFRGEVETHAARRPEWDEESPFRNASTLSYGAFAGPCRRALQWAYKVRLPRLSVLVPPQIWLPVPFEPTIRVTAPWNADAELTAVSAVGLVAEFRRLQELMTEDPVMEELQGLPEGSMLTGYLAEFEGELRTLAHLKTVAERSVEHRLPVIVEG